LSTTRDPDTDELLRQAAGGEDAAVSQLFDRHRQRLRRMIVVRIDRRLRVRVDPSDVVQETLLEALRRLPRYISERPLPFYPWLRQIAWNRLVDLHRRHILARHRSVDREVPLDPPLSSQSIHRLADRLLAQENVPGARLLREELRRRVQQAIALLPDEFREVLVLRHLEQLGVADIAAVLDVAEGTVKSRHFRALAKMRELLEEPT
jgi:RNA polymerase sigma-70 factor (ECF subfamily)